MNIILGFLLMFVYTVQADSYASTTIQEFVPNSFSANCGLKAGDKIVDVNGYSIWNSRDLQFSLATLKCQEVDGHSVEIYKQDCAIEACNAYKKVVADENPDNDTLKDFYGVLQDSCAKINDAATKDEAYEYLLEGLKNIYGYFENSNYDYDNPRIIEKDTRKRFSTDFTVIRNGEKVKINDVQLYTYYADEKAKENDSPSLAFDFYLESIDKNFGSVIEQTFTGTCSMAKTVWTSLVWLVQGRFAFTDLSGPVGIATAVTTVASKGLETGFLSAVNNILFVMILITVNLGIVNMLPFPALDGGRFLFLLIEGIFRKPIPRKVEQVVNAAGLIILILFMIVISFKDVWQLITGTMPGMS